jgi:hypothetical protein
MAAQSDRNEILGLHRLWWESNFDFDIPKIRSVFGGERCLQFKVNGHPYYGKTKLSEALKGQPLDSGNLGADESAPQDISRYGFPISGSDLP